jgi:hypothetical protein
MRRVSVTPGGVGSVKYYVFPRVGVCSEGIQREMRKRHIVICGRLRFYSVPTLSHKRHDFGRGGKRKRREQHKTRVLIFSAAFLILRRTERYMIMYIGLHVKYPLFLSDFYET